MTQLNYASVAEEALVALAARGDDDAFSAVVERRQQWLRGLLRRMCDDADLADDLAQQAFLKAWRELPKLRSTAAFASWLRQIALNLWLQHVRRKDPLMDRVEWEVESLISPAPGVGHDISVALNCLPEAARICVVLAYHEGMSHSEIAKAVHMPLGTVKSHVLRGTKALREHLIAYREGTSTSKDGTQQGIEHD